MNIKKITKLSFFFIIFLAFSISFVGISVLYQIKHNISTKDKISQIVLLQERMNEAIEDQGKAMSLKGLDKLNKKFIEHEEQFETLRKQISLDDDFTFFDFLLKEQKNQKKITSNLNQLFANEHTIELALASINKLQKKYILIQQKFKRLYPQESTLRKSLGSYIFQLKDYESTYIFGQLQYYSKETLYQYRDKESFNKWLNATEDITRLVNFQEITTYKSIVNEIGKTAIAMKEIELKKDELKSNISNTIKNTKQMLLEISRLIEEFSSAGIQKAFYLLVILTTFIIVSIFILGYKVIKHISLSVDEIESKIQEGLFEIGKLNDEITDTQKEVVFTMGAIAEQRSKETGNHVRRVANYSKILALHYGLDEEEAEMLKQASPMHDIGKVAIADVILNKPGRFDKDERKIMNTHAQLGYEMLKGSSRALLKMAATVAKEHHEKWDGSGYPQGLKGEEISIYGRITALADVFDALGSDRVYKKAWDNEKIFALFKEERGKHFEPKLIDIFFEHLDEFLEIQSKYKDSPSQ